jgi:ATP-dependent protease ClpP protease subunit
MNPKRIVTWIGPVGDEKTSNVFDAILALFTNNKSEPVYLVICSNGGFVSGAMAFFDLIASVPKLNLITVGSGEVSSSGLIIWLSGSKRHITAHTTVLLHELSQNISPGYTTKSDAECMAKQLCHANANFADIVTKRSHIGNRKVLSMMSENTILSPAETVKLGLAHKII